jgi:hypothetical protein
MTKATQKKAVEVKAPAVVKAPVKAAKPVKVEKKEPTLDSPILPDQHNEVLANGELFGFSVPTDNDPVKGHESEFGAGMGVSPHCVGGGLTTYKIL